MTLRFAPQVGQTSGMACVTARVTGTACVTARGVEVVRENGRYWITTPNGPIWSIAPPSAEADIRKRQRELTGHVVHHPNAHHAAGVVNDNKFSEDELLAVRCPSFHRTARAIIRSAR
jgi:hypothetical protein